MHALPGAIAHGRLDLSYEAATSLVKLTDMVRLCSHPTIFQPCEDPAASTLMLVILSPIMHIFEPQHMTNFLIRQRRLPFGHVSGDRGAGTMNSEKLLGWNRGCDGVVCGVESLKAQAILEKTEVADLTKIAGVDVTPCITLAGFRLAHVSGKVAGVFVGLNDVADDEGIDVDGESASKGASNAFAGELAAGICIHGISVIVIFVQWEGDVVVVTLAEAYAIGGFTTGNDNLFHTQLARRLDYIVRAHDIGSERFAVRHNHVASIGGKMDDCVRRAWMFGQCILVHGEEGRQGIEGLCSIGQVGLEGVDGFSRWYVVLWEIDQVEIEDLMSLIQKIRDTVATRLARTAGEDDSFRCG